MELDDPGQIGSFPRSTEAGSKQAGERNLATRRHTVGPSDTAHDQVVGKHLKLTHCGTRAPPHFYPSIGVSSLGYSPLNLPSQIAFNPLIGLTQIDQHRLGVLQNVDVAQHPAGVAVSTVNPDSAAASGGQHPSNLFHGR